MDSIGCKEAEKVLTARMKGKDKAPGGSPSTSNHHSPSASFSGVVTHPSTSQQSPPAKIVRENQDQSQTAGRNLEAYGIEALLGHLELTERPPLQMFTAVGAVFQHATRHDEATVDPGGTSNWQAILEGADTLYRSGRIDVRALQVIRSILDYLWLDRPEDELVKASRVLADACRDSRWRVPFRQGGILDFFLEVVATEDVSTDLNSEALRLIGNACADEDTNRESVVSQGFILPIIRQLQNDSLASLAIPVLYNICIDYEPAQEAVRSNLFCPLIDVLARESFDEGSLLDYICPLLNFSLEQSDANQSPDHSIRVLLQLALRPDLEAEDQVSLVNAIAIHLQIDRFQRILIDEDLVNLPLVMIIRSFAPQTLPSASLSLIDLSPAPRDIADEEKLSPVRNSLIRALSDVSANPEFGVKYPVDSELVKSLIHWLSASRSQFQICSCIMLGNHARSDVVCHSMVHDLSIHATLASIVRDSSDIQVLHAALGFLRNLALPLGNKALLGQAEIIETISRFWSMDFAPQLQYSAVSLIRQLLNSSFVNVQRLLVSLSADPDSPAHDKTYLSILLSLFEKTDPGPTRVEIARTIAAIWRCVSSSNPCIDPIILGDIVHRLHSKHANIARPLAMMVTQSQWPVIRSEGWFALALMARSKEGSAAVNIILQQVEVFGALVETVTGHSICTAPTAGAEPISIEPPTNAARTPSADSEPSNEVAAAVAEATSRSSDSSSISTIAARNRENALILINELLRHSGDGMSLIRRSVLEDLLHGRQSDLGFQELMIRAQSLE